jgi:hypothetical protein
VSCPWTFRFISVVQLGWYMTLFCRSDVLLQFEKQFTHIIFFKDLPYFSFTITLHSLNLLVFFLKKKNVVLCS